MLHQDRIAEIQKRFDDVKFQSQQTTTEMVRSGQYNVLVGRELNPTTATYTRTFYNWAKADIEDLLVSHEEMRVELEKLQCRASKVDSLEERAIGVSCDFQNPLNRVIQDADEYNQYESVLASIKRIALLENRNCIVMVQDHIGEVSGFIASIEDLYPIGHRPSVMSTKEVVGRYVYSSGRWLREDQAA